jgi:alpha-tubulin suppressor-like RCC1 family protein
MTKSLTGATLSLALLATAGPEPAAVRLVTAGGTHNIALSADGTVWTWGDGTPVTTPVATTGLPGFLSFVAGRGRTAILASDGTVWNWKAVGQDEGSADALMLAPGLSGVAAVSAAGDHTLAWKIDGSV